ncbi:MAG TPA: type II toxin-antitoxin system VapC family toxin [Anaerolineae bacterium]|nr:type II toxin-antitoxin system VapC family toxin [Anaerolineae bacterium]
MRYLLDTNTCIQFLNSRNSAVQRRLAAVSRDDVAICQIVKAELIYGAYRSARREANLALLARFFSQFVSLPFDDASAEIYGRIRAELVRAGTPIGPNDLMIAAIALAHDAILVTHNVREFGRVEGLRFEDWE